MTGGTEADGPAPREADIFGPLFEDAPCGFLLVSPDWRIERVNATLAEWSGHASEALSGQAFIDLLDIAGKIYVNTHFAPLLRLQGRFDEVALNVVRADGTKLPVLVNARERREADGSLRCVLVSVFNATDRRRYEAELLEARDALREANESLERRVAEEVAERMRVEEALAHAQRMEAIGNLSAGIAHDFNNLLQVIGGNLTLLRKHVPGAAGLARIANAARGVERGARLAGQLLAFGRRQTLDAQVHDLGGAVEELANSLIGTIGKEVELRVEVDRGDRAQGGGAQSDQAEGDGAQGDGPPRLTAHVDLIMLENAVINLAVNARHAMRDEDGIASGTMTLAVSRRAVETTVSGTAAGSAEPGDYVTIELRDTGRGMPAEVAAKAFDPFFTTKRPGEGTGLGLSMVYGFATQSKGHVTIDSAPGEGTCVRLWLPHTAEDPASAPARAPAPSRGRETILLVEDDEGVLDITRELLTDLGYEVLTAADGTSALAVLDASKPIHLVLTDVVMPGPMRGTALAALVEERHPGTPVLFTTGYADAAARIEMGAANGAILHKPFSSEALADAVRAALDRAAKAGAGAGRGTAPRARPTAPHDGTPPGEATDPARADASPAQAEPTSPSVLLVEDESLIRFDAAELLTDLGCAVTDVGSVAEALEELGQARYAALLTDVHLEDGSGVDLARRAREADPDLRIVFATGHGVVDAAGALDATVLSKPYDERGLRRALGLDV